jgi:Ca-activated chloride channel family protein
MKAVLAAGLALLTLAGFPGGRQGPATRPDTIWVTVNVLHKDGQLVTNLTAKDFEIEHNGEKREVAVFRNDAIPIALAIMIDVSSSMETNYGLVRRAVAALTTHFEPGDRAILGSFSSLPWISPRFSARPEVLQRSVAEALGGSLSLCDGDWIDKTRRVGLSEQAKQSFGPVSAFSRRLTMRGGSAIWDGAACGVNAVASDGETPRRIVVLMTDGVDNISSSTAATVIDRANRYGVMIYAVSLMGGYGMAGAELKGLADATGGGYFYLTGEDKVADAFTRIGEELRHQYVLGFTPTGSLAGPHRIVVRSTAPDTTARFRRVLMESPAASPLAAAGAVRAPGTAAPTAALPSGLALDDRTVGFGGAAAATPDTPGTSRTAVWNDLDQFLQPEFTPGIASRRTIADLRTTLTLLRRSGTRWIEAAGAAEQPRRRLAAASFVLDLLYGQNDPYLWLDGQPNPDLLDWAASALEGGPPTPAERVWYFGAAALFERGGVTDPFDRLMTRALRRFPDEPRFVLARAVAQELRTWPEDRDDRAFTPAPSTTALVVSRYEAALKLPPIAFEAGLRLAFFDLRRGRTDAAVARFEALGDPPSQDVVLRFWWRLLKGRALEQANRLPEAIACFEEALNDVPGAASARSALIAALAKAGRQTDAARVAARALSTPAAPIDPWTIYVLPDMRFWPAVEQTLRSAVTR